MSVEKFLASRFKRLIESILNQWFLFIAWSAVYMWNQYFLCNQVQSFFDIETLQNKLELAQRSTDFMKNLASLSNPTAYLNYVTTLMEKASLSTRFNLLQAFSNITQFLLTGLINIGLIVLAFYIVIRIIRTYRQKTNQHENVRLITQELMPKLDALNEEIKTLRAELKALQHGKNNTTDSSHTRI